MKKILLIIILFLLALPSVLSASIVSCYDFDSNFADYEYLNNCTAITNGGAIPTINSTYYKVGSGSIRFDGSGGFLNCTTANIATLKLEEVTIGGWVNRTSDSASGRAIGGMVYERDSSATSWGSYNLRQNNGPPLANYLRTYTGATDDVSYSSGSNNAWHLIIGTVGNGSKSIFVDGTEGLHNALAGNVQYTAKSEFYLGLVHSLSAAVTDGFLDSFFVLNGSMTSDDVTWMYDSGNGRTCAEISTRFYGRGAPDTFTIQAQDSYDLAALSNFTAYITNSTTTLINSTSSGSLVYGDVTSGLYNITIESNESGSYFNKTFYNYNVSPDLTASLYQSVLYLNASELVSGNPISAFTAKIGAWNNHSNTTGWVKLLLRAGTYNLKGNTSGYSNVSKSITIFALETKEDTLEFYTNNLTINVIDIIKGITINVYSVNISSLDFNYATHGSTTIGNLSFNLLNGTYNITVDAGSDYELSNTTATLTIGNYSPNITFYLYTYNSINFSIFDEYDRTHLVGKQVNIEFVSDILSTNVSTNTSFLYIDHLLPSEYRITFSADGYGRRNYWFTLQNRTNNEIELYLLSDGNSTDVNLYLTDAYDHELIDYYVYLLREYIINNKSIYKTIEVEKSDNNGLVKHDVILNDIFYKWIFRKPNKVLIDVTESQQIHLTALYYKLTIGDEYLVKYSNIGDISSSITFDNTTNIITFIYSDSSGLTGDYCLKIEKVSTFSFSVISDQCSTASTGTMSYTLTDTDSNYIATGYISTSGSAHYDTTLAIKEILYKKDWKQFSRSGLLLDGIFIMTLAAAGFVMAGMVGSIIMTVIALGVFGIIGWIALRLIVYISILIYAIILSVRVNKKK